MVAAVTAVAHPNESLSSRQWTLRATTPSRLQSRPQSAASALASAAAEWAMQRAVAVAAFMLVASLPHHVLAFKPGFVSPLENMTVAAGRSAQFTCVVKHLGGHKVAWLRSDSKAILAIHTHMVTNNPRMGVEHNGHNSWTLRISNVMRNDSGIYMCQINTEPMTSQIGVLSVVEAPDILYNETSNDTIVAEGASVRLHCEARGYPEPRVTWRREDGAHINIKSESGKVDRVESVDGPELDLRRLTRADMGAYLCIAANGIPSPVSKRIMIHVHCEGSKSIHPLVKVHDQLITARLGSTVKLVCTVEASPQSVNYWVKRGNAPTDLDQPINPGRRLHPLEMKESLYSMLMTLTIHEVKSSDLGNYTCVARNSMGSVKGTISLQKLYVPPPPSPPPTESSADSNEISDEDDGVTPALIDTEPAFVFLGDGEVEDEAGDEADDGKKTGVAGSRHANRAKTFFAAASSADAMLMFSGTLMQTFAVALNIGLN